MTVQDWSAHPCLIDGVGEAHPHDTPNLVALHIGTPALNLLLEIKDCLTSYLLNCLLRIPGQCPDGSGTSKFWDDLVEEHVSVVLQGVHLRSERSKNFLAVRSWVGACCYSKTCLFSSFFSSLGFRPVSSAQARTRTHSCRDCFKGHLPGPFPYRPVET